MQNYKQIYNILMFFAILLLAIGTYWVYKTYITNQIKNGYVNQFSSSEQKNNINFQNIQKTLDKNDFKTSNQLIDRELSLDPDNVLLLIAKASNLAQEASLTFREKELGNQARALLLQVLQTKPENVQALTLIGYTYEIQEDFQNAHKYYDKALKINPTNSDTLAQKAHAYDIEGNIDVAENYYKKSLLSSPENEKANVGIARIYFQKGKLSEALMIFKKIAEMQTNARTIAEAAYSAGIISSQLNDDQTQALTYFRKAASVDPNYALPWVGIATALYTQSMISKDLPLETRNQLISESIESLKKAITVNPNQTIALYQLGTQLYTLGQKDAGKKFLQKALEVSSVDITLSPTEKKNMGEQISALLKKLK